MEKKLEIIGPYTPEHPGPFCTREKAPVELLFRNGRAPYPNGGYIGDRTTVVEWGSAGQYYVDDQCRSPDDLMNAREVPVAREFWVNEYRGVLGNSFGRAHISVKEAMEVGDGRGDCIRVIHVREVLPEAADVSPTVSGVPAPASEKDQDGLLPAVAWEGRDYHSGYELGFSRDRDKDFLDEQPSSGEVAWYPLVRRSDALREIEALRHALREARARISSLVNAKPATAASQGTDGEGQVQ